MNLDHGQWIKARLEESKKWRWGVSIGRLFFSVKLISKSLIFTYFRKRDFDVGLFLRVSGGSREEVVSFFWEL